MSVTTVRLQPGIEQGLQAMIKPNRFMNTTEHLPSFPSPLSATLSFYKRTKRLPKTNCCLSVGSVRVW